MMYDVMCVFMMHHVSLMFLYTFVMHVEKLRGDTTPAERKGKL